MRVTASSPGRAHILTMFFFRILTKGLYLCRALEMRAILGHLEKLVLGATGVGWSAVELEL